MTSGERLCRVQTCSQPAIGTRQYCPPCQKAAGQWLRDEAWLDDMQERRQTWQADPQKDGRLNPYWEFGAERNA